MLIIRSLIISFIVSFIFGIASTLMYSSFFEYKNSAPSEIDFQSMTVAEGEAWHQENAITKSGFAALKVVFSDWFMFKHWFVSQWLIFIACFVSSLLSLRFNKANGS